jgi:DNA-binding MarR family transcriptional regulator
LRAELNEYLAEFALNDVRYLVLKAIDSAGPSGCTQTELAETLCQSESNVCTLVERMRSDGLLYRLRSKGDRRKRILLLTEQARQIVARIDACYDQEMSRVLRGLRVEERQVLVCLLRELQTAILERRSRPASVEAPAMASLPPPPPHFGQRVVRCDD